MKNIELIKTLIENGADVNKIDSSHINNTNFADQIRSNRKLCVPIERFQEHCINEENPIKDPISLENFTNDNRINTVITPSNTCYNRNQLRTYYSLNQNTIEDPLRNPIPNKWRLDNLYEGPCNTEP